MNVPVRFRAQQQAKYSLLLLKANCIAAQTDWRITEHRGHKFSPSLPLLSVQNSNWNYGLQIDHNRKFSERIFSTPAIFKATSKFFGSLGCSADKNWLELSSNFFRICRFRSSILFSLQVFIPREATLKSSLIVAWFSWTNHNPLLRIATNGIASFCIDHKWRQMAFFRVCQNGEGPTFARLTWNKAAFMRMKFNFLLYKTNRFHVAVHLSSNRSQSTSKCGKNISDTLGYRLVCHFFVLTTFWRHLWSITGQMHGNMESIC